MKLISDAIFLTKGLVEVGFVATINHCIEFTICVSNLLYLNLLNI